MAKSVVDVVKEIKNRYLAIRYRYAREGKNTVPKMKSFVLAGPPGVGKTTLVYQMSKEIAEALGKKFMDLRDGEVLGEVRTILKKVENAVIEDLGYEDEKEIKRRLKEALSPYFFFYVLDLSAHSATDFVAPDLIHNERYIRRKVDEIFYIYTSGEGVLLIDELYNVLNDQNKQTLMYGLFQPLKMIGGHSLNPNVLVIGAGNPPAYNPDAACFSPALADRIEIRLVEAPTAEQWIDYMMKEDSSIPLDVVVFASRFVDEYRIKEYEKEKMQNWGMSDEVELAFMTPRSVELAVLDWYNFCCVAKNPVKELEDSLESTIGKEPAQRFIMYLKEREKIFQLSKLSYEELKEIVKKAGFHFVHSAFVLLGQVGRDFVLGSPSKVAMAYDDWVKSVNRLVDFVSKEGKSKEVFTMLFFGAGVFRKGEPFINSLKVCEFIKKALVEGKSFDEVKDCVSKFDKISLQQLIYADKDGVKFVSKMVDLKKIDQKNVKNGDLAFVYQEYVSQKLDKIVGLIDKYIGMGGKLDESEKKELVDMIGKEGLEDIERGIAKKSYDMLLKKVQKMNSRP